MLARRLRQALLAGFLVVATVALVACGAVPVGPDPSSKLVKVVFPAKYVRKYVVNSSQATPEAVAKQFASNHRYYTSVFARDSGDVVAKMTQDQLDLHLDDDRREIAKDTQKFHQEDPAYQFKYDDNSHNFSIWLNKNISSQSFTAMVGRVPYLTGLDYYLQGGSELWDSILDVYNCHNNQLIHQIDFSQKWTFQQEELGE